MAICKWCGKKGIFVMVNQRGLCSACQSTLEPEFSQRARIISESIELIQKSKNLTTKLSRCDVITENIEALLPYEEAGITVTDPPPSELLDQIRKTKRDIVVSGTLEAIETIMNKARLVPSTKTKVNEATKALIKITQARKEIDGSVNELDQAENEIKEFIRAVQLETHIEAAQKAEFKGQIKKAVDQYQEALYLLKTDEVPDEAQKKQITEIESKIAELMSQKEKG